jgi:hypothetical protein
MAPPSNIRNPYFEDYSLPSVFEQCASQDIAQQ